MVDAKLCDVNDKFGNLFDAVIDYLIFHEINKNLFLSTLQSFLSR